MNLPRAEKDELMRVMGVESAFPAKIANKVEVDPKLTPRELQAFEQLGRGVKNKKIAEILKISIKTLDIHRSNIRRKLETSNYVAAWIAYNVHNG